jgi:hypothetical protein
MSFGEQCWHEWVGSTLESRIAVVHRHTSSRFVHRHLRTVLRLLLAAGHGHLVAGSQLQGLGPLLPSSLLNIASFGGGLDANSGSPHCPGGGLFNLENAQRNKQMIRGSLSQCSTGNALHVLASLTS